MDLTSIALEASGLIAPVTPFGRALILLAIVPCVLLPWRWSVVLGTLVLEGAAALLLLESGSEAATVAAVLFGANLMLAIIAVARTNRRLAALEKRFQLAEEAISELRVSEERRRATSARDSLHAFPVPPRGRANLEVIEHTGQG